MNKKIPYICMYLLSSLASISTTTVCASSKRTQATPDELIFLVSAQDVAQSWWPFMEESINYQVPEKGYFFPVCCMNELLKEALDGKAVIKISTEKLQGKFLLVNQEGPVMYRYLDQFIPGTAVINYFKN